MTNLSFNGLEICYHAFKNQIKRDSDAIVLFVHWYLVQNGFGCVVEGRRSEILPENWNADENIYVLNYSYLSNGYELKVLISDDALIINLMKKSSERTATVTCNIRDHVSNYRNEFQNLYINLNDLYESLHKEFEALYKPENKAESTVTTEETRRRSPDRSQQIIDPLRIGPPQGPFIPPTNIGRSDLDPFGRFEPLGGGGMVFDPLRQMRDPRVIPSNLPRGAVPPGARFDPFGPPNPDDLIGGSTYVGPNPSHLRKPKFDDNMFM